MNNPHFVYLPKLDRFLNLANVALAEQQWDGILIRTTLPDGKQYDEGEDYCPVHFTFMVKDAEDCNILCRSARHFTINTHEAPTAEKVTL